MCFLIAAPLEITPQMRFLVDTWVRAGQAAEKWGTKDFAYCMGLTVEQWKRQLAGEPGQHVSAYRMALSPVSIMREWIKTIAPAFGLVVYDRRDDIVRLIESVDALTASQQQERRRA